MKRIIVGVADMQLAQADETLVTHALGSCLGVAIHDPVAQVGGLLHAMLPLSKINPDKAQANPAMFADRGVPVLFKSASELGAAKKRLVVKVAGGSSLLDDNSRHGTQWQIVQPDAYAAAIGFRAARIFVPAGCRIIVKRRSAPVGSGRHGSDRIAGTTTSIVRLRDPIEHRAVDQTGTHAIVGDGDKNVVRLGLHQQQWKVNHPGGQHQSGQFAVRDTAGQHVISRRCELVGR